MKFFTWENRSSRRLNLRLNFHACKRSYLAIRTLASTSTCLPCSTSNPSRKHTSSLFIGSVRICSNLRKLVISPKGNPVCSYHLWEQFVCYAIAEPLQLSDLNNKPVRTGIPGLARVNERRVQILDEHKKAAEGMFRAYAKVLERLHPVLKSIALAAPAPKAKLPSRDFLRRSHAALSVLPPASLHFLIGRGWNWLMDRGRRRRESGRRRRWRRGWWRRSGGGAPGSWRSGLTSTNYGPKPGPNTLLK